LEFSFLVICFCGRPYADVSREVDWKNGKVQIWHLERKKESERQLKFKPVFGSVSVSNYSL
jgi:hypothetical protein